MFEFQPSLQKPKERTIWERQRSKIKGNHWNSRGLAKPNASANSQIDLNSNQSPQTGTGASQGMEMTLYQYREAISRAQVNHDLILNQIQINHDLILNQNQINHDVILNQKMAEHQAEINLIQRQVELIHRQQFNLLKEKMREEHFALMSAAEAEHKLEKEELNKQVSLLKACIPKHQAAAYGAAHLNVSDEATKSQWKDNANAYMASLTSAAFDSSNPFSEYSCQSRPEAGPRPSIDPKCEGCAKSAAHMDKLDAELQWFHEFVFESALKVKNILRTEAEKVGRLEECLSCSVKEIGGKDSLDTLIETMDERDKAQKEADRANSSNKHLKEQMREYMDFYADFGEIKEERDAIKQELQELKDNYRKWKSGQAIASTALQSARSDLADQIADGIAIRAEKEKLEKELCAAKTKIQILESSVHVAGHQVTSPEDTTEAAHVEGKKADQEAHHIHPNTSAGQAQLALFTFMATLAAVSLAGAFIFEAAPGISSAASFVGSTIASLAAKAAPHAELWCSKNDICRDLVFGA